MLGMDNGLMKDLEAWQEEHVSSYCLESCAKTCCGGKNSIQMTESQVKKAYGIREEADLESPVIVDFFARHWVVLEDKEKGLYRVPTYNGSLWPYCMAYDIHTNGCKLQDDKPEWCKEFPLLLQENEEEGLAVHFNERCEIHKTNPDAMAVLADICKSHDVLFAIGTKIQK